jgi:hypothetical protein
MAQIEKEISGSLQLESRDLIPAVVAMSGLYRARVVVLAVLTLAIAASVYSSRGHLASAAPQLVFFAAFAAILLLGPRRTARRVLRALTGGGVATASYRFGAEHATLRTGAATSAFAYRDIHRTRELPTAFLVYVTPEVANIVVKRAFSDEDLTTVRERLFSARAKR